MRDNCRRFGIVVFTAVVFVVLAEAPAFGHAALLSTNPADGSVYPTASPPHSVLLHFGESVGIKLGAVRLYDEHGGLVNTGVPTHPAGGDNRVSVSLPKLGSGTYVVTWRVISADTHPVSGAFTFSVGSEQKNVSALTQKLLSSAEGSRLVGVLYGVERFLLFASLIAFLGGTAFIVLVWPAGRRSRRVAHILWISWGVAVGATALGFAIEGIYAAAYPFSKLLDPAVLRDTLHGRFGETALVRLALLAAAVPLLRRLLSTNVGEDDPKRLPPWWAPTAFIVGIATIVTITLASHGTTGRWTGLAIPADVLHVSAVSLWFGGLLMLTAAVVPAADSSTLDRVVPRYSNLAFGAVVTIIASGTFQAARQVGTIHALFSTVYGHFLLAKLFAFGLLIVFAMVSREVVNGWYAPRRDRQKRAIALAATSSPDLGPGSGVALAERPDPEAVDTDNNGDRDDDRRARTALLRLRQTIAVEVAVALIVLALTALLVDARPAYEVTNGPQVLRLESSPSRTSVVFDLVVQPAKRGSNQIHVSAETPTGRVAHPLEVTIEFTNPSHDVGPLRARLVRLSPGHFLAYSFNLPLTGTWQVTVRALMTEFDEAVATGSVSIR